MRRLQREEAICEEAKEGAMLPQRHCARHRPVKRELFFGFAAECPRETYDVVGKDPKVILTAGDLCEGFGWLTVGNDRDSVGVCW